ncbi:hypothetical protein [Natranaerofaba carboxydovora]|uniref:hypothetical protein n=1 Tax=Natranaerofaba carboxydovora TaxID=2742683 RepID=UPI001F147EFF|nr:hypothetical protein [Natranaerofaba carboxydovora]UMZ73718.1 hypothetical protein ACONDI_01284 [Natranaerofaba carboxydovora]
MRKLLILLLFIIIVPVLLLGYIGIIPGVSDILGSNRPRDLGVRPEYYENLQSVRGKLSGMRLENPADIILTSENEQEAWERLSTINFEPVAVNTGFSSEEFTSLLQTGSWYNWPLYDVQTRFNPDGSAEVSGMVDADKLRGFAVRTGISAEAFDNFATDLILNRDMPFYARAQGAVVNNQVDLQISRVELGRAPLTALANRYEHDIDVYLTDGIAKMPQVSVTRLDVQDGELRYDGELPSWSPHW